MGKRRFYVHNLFPFRRRSRAPFSPAAAPPAGGARPGGSKNRLFPTISRSPFFPCFTRDPSVFDIVGNSVSRPEKNGSAPPKGTAKPLVSYAQKNHRHFVQIVCFSPRNFYPCTFCTKCVLVAFFDLSEPDLSIFVKLAFLRLECLRLTSSGSFGPTFPSRGRLRDSSTPLVLLASLRMTR